MQKTDLICLPQGGFPVRGALIRHFWTTTSPTEKKW
ncbi:unnamed protein product [Haemonchus placei]|uniref:Uncharacterized protein n=1 Tax=Haemonchus placei TaxID=6290 RepID=A0A3P8AUU6_HAEPC|nr:unnamed protein product [Haemonchus placei]